jgi:hypothetical protein
VFRWARIGLVLAVGVFFFLWHAPLLSEAGRVRGFNSDAAIIALMGKKMAEGRGFDVFFWGQNYIGPLTSSFIALFGLIRGTVDPLALRLGTMVEVLLGILLMGWAVSRIDRRAAVATMVALAITPPVILRMMITPLGAEMAFLMGAALLALLLWYPRPLLLGVVAGIGWWMNQQVVFTLMAAALVLGWPRIRSFLPRPLALWRLEGLSGIPHALAWVLTRLGALLLVLFVVFDLLRVDVIPFVFGRATDALILLLVPLVLLHLRTVMLSRGDGEASPDATVSHPEILRSAQDDGRRWSVPLFVAGFALGYAPVWLGRIFGWYDRTYVFAFRLNYPSEVVEQVRSFWMVAAHWIGAAPGILGILYALVFCVFLVAGVRSARTEARILLALIPLANLAFYFVTAGVKPHYLIASVGPLFGVAALGAVDLWSRYRVPVIAGALIAILSLGTSAKLMHRELLAERDPLPLLAQIRAANCAVTYADFWVAYRYRFLDGERGAWIPYLSQNRTRAESFAAQRRPGQRCRVLEDGSVVRLAHDLSVVHQPPRRR